jgi:hypothetical protein
MNMIRTHVSELLLGLWLEVNDTNNSVTKVLLFIVQV